VRRHEMKRILLLGMTLFLLMNGYVLSDVTYQSDFGFKIVLPSGWTFISSKDVKDKPDIVKVALDTAEKNNTLKNLPQELYGKLKEKLTGG
jgi:hypothetical protein